MSQRFYMPQPTSDRVVTLEGEEAHHLIHVMRAKTGQSVILFDGQNGEYQGRVVSVQRKTVDIELLDRQVVNRELPRPLHLAVALPKADRQRWLVEKAVELGVTSLTPLQAERTVAEPTSKSLDRLRRIVVEASKQCGRNRLMEIRSPHASHAFFAGEPRGSTRWIAQPPGENDPENAKHSSPRHPPAGPLLVAVGPEGGFSDRELQVALDAGWQRLDLGPRVLRVETAVLAIAAWIALCLTAFEPPSQGSPARDE